MSTIKLRKKWCIYLIPALLSIQLASAGECLREAREAKQSGVKNLVISFEGLGAKNLGFVRNGLLAKIGKEIRRTAVSKNYDYTEDDKAYACVKDFKKIYKEDIRITIIGHSFGGGIGTFKLLARMNGQAVQNVITLDPRSMDGDSKYWRLMSQNYNKNDFRKVSFNKNNKKKEPSEAVFECPKNVKIGNFYNFYQKGGMPGYEVKGARNFELKNISHISVPADRKVQKATKNLILGSR